MDDVLALIKESGVAQALEDFGLVKESAPKPESGATYNQRRALNRGSAVPSQRLIPPSPIQFNLPIPDRGLDLRNQILAGVSEMGERRRSPRPKVAPSNPRVSPQFLTNAPLVSAPAPAPNTSVLYARDSTYLDPTRARAILESYDPRIVQVAENRAQVARDLAPRPPIQASSSGVSSPTPVNETQVLPRSERVKVLPPVVEPPAPKPAAPKPAVPTNSASLLEALRNVKISPRGGALGLAALLGLGTTGALMSYDDANRDRGFFG